MSIFNVGVMKMEMNIFGNGLADKLDRCIYSGFIFAGLTIIL
jgi:hypothetical protein